MSACLFKVLAGYHHLRQRLGVVPPKVEVVRLKVEVVPSKVEEG